MAGASGASSWPPDSILPEVHFVLNWNPPQMHIGDATDVEMRPPHTAPKARRTTTIGCSRKAAFYDKHLASHLILERVVHLDELVSVMAGTVDKAIQDAIAKQPLPKDSGSLMPQKLIERLVWEDSWTKYHESGIGDAYKVHTSAYCLPIASTLAIHPSSEDWGKVMLWTVDGRTERWAIADGLLIISPNIFEDGHMVQKSLKNEDNRKIILLKELARRPTTLAVWEMKNLTAGAVPRHCGCDE